MQDHPCCLLFFHGFLRRPFVLPARFANISVPLPSIADRQDKRSLGYASYSACLDEFRLVRSSASPWLVQGILQLPTNRPGCVKPMAGRYMVQSLDCFSRIALFLISTTCANISSASFNLFSNMHMIAAFSRLVSLPVFSFLP